MKPLQQPLNTMYSSRKKRILPFLSCLSLVGFSHGAVIAISEGFNSTFANPYGGQTFGVQYGVTGPGITADGNNGTDATEGDSFAALNTQHTGGATIIGAMDIFMGTVELTDVGKTLTFTGDFGWRFGTTASADDLGIHVAQTGFQIGDVTGPGGTTKKDSFSNFDFGNHTQNVFEQASFSYTIVNGDIGDDIHLRIRLVDSGVDDGGLTQLLTDNWVVTIPEPSVALLAGLGALVLLRRRRG